MVATVGSISIDLSTNTHTFTQGFKKAATTVERESGRMSKAVKGIGNIGAGFIGGIAGGAAFAAIGSFSGAIQKATQALSDFEKIGISAKSAGLGTDFFQALSFGAAQADVETETLNRSLEIFAKNVGLAREGTGALYSGLIKLNPELLKAVLTADDQEDRLKLVAEAMSRMTDQTQKAALAAAAFGRGGEDLIRVLDGGAAALDRMQQNARELGIIIPADLIERAGALDDQLTTLSMVIDVNLNQALVNAAPLLVKAAEGLADVAKQVNVASAALTNFVNNPSMETFGEFLKTIGAEGESIDWGSKMVNAISGVINAAEPLGDTFEEVNANIAQAQTELRELVDLAKTSGLEDDFGKGLEERINRLLDRLIALQQRLVDVGKTAAAVGNRMGDAFLQFRAQETRYAHPAAGGGTLPTLPRVYHGTELQGTVKVDPEVMDGVEAAIAEETEATREAPYITGRYVETLDDHTSGYFDRLGSELDTGFHYLGGVFTDGFQAMTKSAIEAARINAEGFRFSGTGPGSWGGRRVTAQAPLTQFEELAGITAMRDVTAMEAQLANLQGAAENLGTLAAGAFADEIARLESEIAWRQNPEDLQRRLDSAFGETSSSGRSITLNYNAAPGESDGTSRQNARTMGEIIQRELARA